MPRWPVCPDVGAAWAAMEPFCLDFGRWPTVIIHSDVHTRVHVHVHDQVTPKFLYMDEYR